ncbi:MAG: hypothetical protein PWP46_1996 [Fusobacteriaceae bacterium]|jgi:uncharacterized protein YnzC (UPF0291/DUF896 family)|nr:hypothetical protein [Fusobacteriaceae bacterium]
MSEKMDMSSIIKMVNYYSGVAKQRELTEEEKIDREKYRKLYLEQFRAQVRGHLDSIKIVNENEIN